MGSGFNYPNGEDVFFVNNKTGFIIAELFFEELDFDEFKGREERVYKPSSLTRYAYERETLDHPILGEKVDGVRVDSRTWSIDSKYKRYDREAIRTLFAIFDENWDPSSGEARELKYIMIESYYEGQPDQGRQSVKKPLDYTETLRAFHFPEVMFMYVAAGDPPRMTFFSPRERLDTILEKDPLDHTFPKIDSYEVGGRFISREDIPVDLGVPKRIKF